MLLVQVLHSSDVFSTFTHPDCGIHSSCGQPMNASIRAVLKVQTVNRFLVVPCNLARHHLHVVYQARPQNGEKSKNLLIQTDLRGFYKVSSLPYTDRYLHTLGKIHSGLKDT